MLHRLCRGDICPSCLQSQNPKSNQVARLLEEWPRNAKEDDGQELHKGQALS